MSEKSATIHSESEMLDFGAALGQRLTPPAVIELVGDVGAGKTTLTRGIAKALKVEGAVTSPSFTISKVYAFPGGQLVHYDFYRLPEPGLMAEDLDENLAADNTITIIEWGESVSAILPPHRQKVTITLNPDGSRTVTEETL